MGPQEKKQKKRGCFHQNLLRNKDPKIKSNMVQYFFLIMVLKKGKMHTNKATHWQPSI